MNNFLGALVALFLSATQALQPAVIESTPTPPSPQEIALGEFLEAKGSPMPANILIQYPNWEMMVAISAAESGYCKHPAGDFNCYGIKDFRPGERFGKYRNFESWDESIDYVSTLLFKYDEEDGNPEPHAMVVRWKGDYHTTHWLKNVSYSLWDLEQNVLNA